jgi:hypothetical protein
MGTTASARASAAAPALLPVTQAPQLKPTIARTTAPPAAPHNTGLVSIGMFIALFLQLVTQLTTVAGRHQAAPPLLVWTTGDPCFAPASVRLRTRLRPGPRRCSHDAQGQTHAIDA